MLRLHSPDSTSIRFASTTARLVVVLGTCLMATAAAAQDTPLEEEYTGAPDEAAPDDGATVDYTDSDAPPPPIDDKEDDGGDWGGSEDDPDSFGTPADAPPPPPPADPYAGDDYGEEAYAGEPEAAPPKNLPPVEGMDDFEVFGATFGAAAAMNVGVGGVFALATAGSAVASAAAPGASGAFQTINSVICLPSCIWGCFAAPAATGFLVAYLGDMLGKKRGAILFPALAAYGSAIVLSLTVGVGGALLSGLLVPQNINFNDPLATRPLTVSETAIVQSISLMTAAAIGVGMSAAAAATYMALAEDRRPGDEGGGMPGMVEPAHSVPLRLSAKPASAPTLAQRY